MKKTPLISPAARVFPGAVVEGDVTLGDDCAIWYNAVVRGDLDAITVGPRTNIQDGCVVHEDEGFPVSIGSDVTVGHGAILHGCTVGEGSLIGMGSILMNGVRVGKNCIVGAGALLTESTEIPDGSLALGSPAKVVRPLTEDEKAANYTSAASYVALMNDE